MDQIVKRQGSHSAPNSFGEPFKPGNKSDEKNYGTDRTKRNINIKDLIKLITQNRRLLAKFQYISFIQSSLFPNADRLLQ